jgi:uncharacterized protein YndB with AHSA1/START domain
MTTIRGTTSAKVDAPADAVFAKITDVAELPSWNAAMTRVCERPEKLGPGAHWVVEFHVLGRTWRSRSLCESLDATERRFTYRSGTDDGNPSYARWQWAVRPSGDASEVEVSWELHPVTFWRRVLLARVRARQLAKQEVNASLVELDRALSGSRSVR